DPLPEVTPELAEVRRLGPDDPARVLRTEVVEREEIGLLEIELLEIRLDHGGGSGLLLAEGPVPLRSVLAEVDASARTHREHDPVAHMGADRIEMSIPDDDVRDAEVPREELNV